MVVNDGVESNCAGIHSVVEQGVGLAESVLLGRERLEGISTTGVGCCGAKERLGDVVFLCDLLTLGSWFSWFSLSVNGRFGPSSGTAMSSTSWIDRFLGAADGDGGIEFDGGSGERLIFVSISVGAEGSAIGVQIIGSELVQTGKQGNRWRYGCKTGEGYRK